MESKPGPVEDLKSFSNEISQIHTVDSVYKAKWSIDLSEVTVRASRMDERRRREKDLQPSI